MADDFAKDIRERWQAAERADHENREEALADLKFEAGEHWDSQVREYRESPERNGTGVPLPCLTINTIPQYIGQVIGDRRANQTSIKVLPREDGDVKVAEVRSELIRSIELQSRADRVYALAFGQAVSCGIGNFRVDLDYAYDDVFERDLFIRGIANPLAVLWDPMSADPTGRDAGFCFVSDKMPKAEYERQYKDKAANSLDATGLQEGTDQDTVRVAEYHEIIEKERILALMADGKVVDVTEMDQANWVPMAFVGPDGQPRVRKSPRKYAKMTLTNGQEPLADALELPICRLPIIRVLGREVWVGDKRVRYGLTRFARDPARLKDYWRSVLAEKLMFAPRHNYIAEAAAIENREADWLNTLVYNSGKQMPVETTQSNMVALANEAQMCSQDMKDVTGLHDASLGMKSNETSGVAIQRRQNEGDIATIVYHDNMNAAQQEAGEVLNQLIPTVYDTMRIIRTVGVDDAVKQVEINNPENPEAINLAVGRYDTTISTGPTHSTKRQEGAAQLMELSGRSPKIVDAAGDLIIDQLDIINGDKIAERVKRTIPPEILGDDADAEKDPERAQAQAEAAQQAKSLQETMTVLELKLKTAQVNEAEGKARLAVKLAEDAEKGLNKQSVDGYNAETGRIKAITAKDFPLPPEAAAILAPIVTQAIMNALQSPDVLPGDMQREIAESAFDQAANSRVDELETEQARAEMNREPPEEEMAA